MDQSSSCNYVTLINHEHEPMMLMLILIIDGSLLLYSLLHNVLIVRQH